MAARFTSQWKLAVVWTLSLLIVGAVSFSAQGRPRPRVPRLPSGLLTESPTVISGNDIGFRMERTTDGIAIGRLVVRVDGRWVDTDMMISGQPR
jgi:hypothetical protein